MVTLPLPTILPYLELGLQANHQGLIPYFSCELAAMSHINAPKKAEPGAITRLNRLWIQGHVYKLVITRSIRCQRHHQCLDNLHVIVLKCRKSKEQLEQRNKESLVFHLALCDSHGPFTTLLSAQKLFPLFLFQRWLVNNISP